MLVASSVRITFAPAKTPPDESVTVPVNCAVYVAWQRRSAGVPIARRMVSITRRIVDIRPPMKLLITFAILATFFFYFLFLSVSSELFRPSWKATWFRTSVYGQICFEFEDYPFPVAPRKVM